MVRRRRDTLGNVVGRGEGWGDRVRVYLPRVPCQRERNRDGRGEREEEQARRSREGENRGAFFRAGYSLPNIAGVSSSAHSCHAVHQ